MNSIYCQTTVLDFDMFTIDSMWVVTRFFPPNIVKNVRKSEYNQLKEIDAVRNLMIKFTICLIRHFNDITHLSRRIYEYTYMLILISKTFT